MLPTVPSFKLKSEMLSQRRRRLAIGAAVVIAVIVGFVWLRPSDNSPDPESADGQFPVGQVSVPNVVGLAFDEVQDQMDFVGLVHSPQGDTDKPAAWQTPVAGAPVDYGTQVTVGYGDEPKPGDVEFTDVAASDLEPVTPPSLDPADSPFPGGENFTQEEIDQVNEEVFPEPVQDTTPPGTQIGLWVRYEYDTPADNEDQYELRLVIDGETVDTFKLDRSTGCQNLSRDLGAPIDAESIVSLELHGPPGFKGAVARPAYEFFDPGIQALIVDSGIDGIVLPQLTWEGNGQGCAKP